MRPSWKRAIVVVPALALLIATLTACGSSSGGSSSGGAFQVGLTADLTQSLAPLGTSLQAGYADYFNGVNASGGIDGHKVDLTVLDDQANATLGVANVKRLIETQHVSVVGNLLSNIALAAQPIADANKTPMIAYSVPTNLIYPPNPYVFLADAVDGDEPGPMIQYAASHVPSHARVGIMQIQSSALASFNSNLVSLSGKRGWSVVSNQQVPLDATSAASAATAVAAKQPDVIFVALLAPLLVSAVQTLRQQGYKGLIISYDSSASYSLMKQINDPGLIAIAPYQYVGTAGSGPDVQKLNAAAQADKSDPHSALIVSGYTQAMLIGMALTKCGYPCSGSKMATELDSLNNVNTGGLTFGPWTWTASNHAGIQFVKMYAWDPATQAMKAVSGTLQMPHIG